MSSPEQEQVPTRDGFEALVVLTIQGFGSSEAAAAFARSFAATMTHRVDGDDTADAAYATGAQFCNAAFSEPYVRRVELPESWYSGEEEEKVDVGETLYSLYSRACTQLSAPLLPREVVQIEDVVGIYNRLIDAFVGDGGRGVEVAELVDAMCEALDSHDFHVDQRVGEENEDA